jgi:hypothetical protein
MNPATPGNINKMATKIILQALGFDKRERMLDAGPWQKA